MSYSGNRVACESILVETRCLDPTYFLRFVQDAFQRGLLSFRPQGRGNMFRFV